MTQSAIPQVDMATFATLIRDRRKALGLSQEAVAASAFGNLNRKTYVSALENNRRSGITLHSALRLAEALQIAPQDLPSSLQPAHIAPTVAAPQVHEADIAQAFHAALLQTLEHTVLDGYLRLLRRGLVTLRKWTGAPFSPRSLAVCFALSYVYIVYGGVLAFGAGGGQIGAIAPFGHPGWAVGVPTWVLTTGILIVLILSSYATFRLVRPPDQIDVPIWAKMARVACGAAISGAGCAAAGIFGAQPIAVALSVAIFALGAVSAWPPVVAAVATAAGALIAGFGNAIANDGVMSFSLLGFTVCGALLGALAGGIASLIARDVPYTGPAALAGAGGAITVGAAGAALALWSSQQFDYAFTEGQVVLILMWLILPMVNAVSDYLSLGFSHLLGRLILRHHQSWWRIIAVTLADLIVAFAVLALTILLIWFGLTVSIDTFGLKLDTMAFFATSFADPYGTGLWLTIMLLTTLTWSLLHLICVMAPIVAAKLVNVVLEAPAMAVLRQEDQQVMLQLENASTIATRRTTFILCCGGFAMLPILGALKLFNAASANAPI